MLYCEVWWQLSADWVYTTRFGTEMSFVIGGRSVTSEELKLETKGCLYSLCCLATTEVLYLIL